MKFIHIERKPKGRCEIVWRLWVDGECVYRVSNWTMGPEEAADHVAESMGLKVSHVTYGLHSAVAIAS